MPYYEYHCAQNERTVEVRHGMSDHVATWGELTSRAGLATGETPADTPVERILSAPVPLTGTDGGQEAPGCGPRCACVPQA